MFQYSLPHVGHNNPEPEYREVRESNPEQAALKRALSDYQILTSLHEKPCDDLRHVVARSCDCFFAAVCFLDADQVWIKSTLCPEIRQLSRQEAFANQVAVENGFISLSAAQFSEIELGNELSELKFFAGAPITVSGGLAVGALIVADRTQRDLSDVQVESLKAIARTLSALLESRKDSLELIKAHQIETEINKRLLHANQVITLAEMAGGIAHEINNPLAILQITLEGARQSLNQLSISDARLHKFILSMENSVHRITKITKSLCRYCRDTTSDPPTANKLLEIWEMTYPFCKDQLHEKSIMLKLGLSDLNLTLNCDAVQISQVILNLIKNSSDAIEHLNEKWIHLSAAEEGPWIHISVSNSGPKISDALCEQIFSPFFTTKALGKGSGLGLGICKRILEDHGGLLKLDMSAENTRFLIILPKVQPSQS